MRKKLTPTQKAKRAKNRKVFYAKYVAHSEKAAFFTSKGHSDLSEDCRRIAREAFNKYLENGGREQ